MAAAGLADVLVRDPHPLVIVGRVGHSLDQAPIELLDVAGVIQDALDVGESGRERVADALELIDREHPRSAAGGGDAELDPLAREREREQLRHLRLHRRDLAAQVGTRGALVMLVEDSVEAGRGRRGNPGHPLVGRGQHLGKLAYLQLLEHLGHRPLLTSVRRFYSRGSAPERGNVRRASCSRRATAPPRSRRRARP